MADAFYQEFCNAILGAPTHSAIDLNTDDVKVGLRDEGVTAINLATQVDHADITSALVATSTNVGTPTVGVVAYGVFDHDNVTFSAVSGASCESLDYWKDSGVSATSPLICNLDSATGLPVTPNGGDITWTPNASGVFQITTG
jgi:hypothetical protein